MKDFSYITNSHPTFIEGLYKQFLEAPESIDPDIKKFFEGFGIINPQDLANWISEQ